MSTVHLLDAHTVAAPAFQETLELDDIEADRADDDVATLVDDEIDLVARVDLQPVSDRSWAT